jgi:hypothetical protein
MLDVIFAPLFVGITEKIVLAMTESNKPNKSNPDAPLGKQVLAGGLATVTVFAGEKLLFKMAKHPILIFGLGMIAGGAV